MNNVFLADLVNKFEESATLALSAKAKKLATEGKSIINFGVGEPDFVTPEPIIHAALNAAKKGETKYTAVGGSPALRSAIARRLSEDYKVDFKPSEILASNGGKQAIFHFLQAIVNPGDEVIIPKPYWVSFPEMVKMIGGIPIFVDALSGDFNFEDLKAKLSPKTKVFILNSPSNPSGTVFGANSLKKLLDILEPTSAWLMSDDTYYRLVFEPAVWVSPLNLKPEWKSRTCVIGSTSKSYAMTGWRLGWAAAPEFLIEGMIKIQSQVTSSPSSISQAAAIEALQGSHKVSEDFRKLFQTRRDFFLNEIKQIPQVEFMEPHGAFYVFLRVGHLLNESVSQFAEHLLYQYGVCAIPGEGFGAPEYLRFSYALSEDSIKEGIKRFKEGLFSRLRR